MICLCTEAYKVLFRGGRTLLFFEKLYCLRSIVKIQAYCLQTFAGVTTARLGHACKYSLRYAHACVNLVGHQIFCYQKVGRGEKGWETLSVD